MLSQPEPTNYYYACYQPEGASRPLRRAERGALDSPAVRQYLTRPGLGPHLAGPSALAPAQRRAPVGGCAPRKLSGGHGAGSRAGPGQDHGGAGPSDTLCRRRCCRRVGMHLYTCQEGGAGPTWGVGHGVGSRAGPCQDFHAGQAPLTRATSLPPQTGQRRSAQTKKSSAPRSGPCVAPSSGSRAPA